MTNNFSSPVFEYASSNYSTLERDCNFAINNYLKHCPQPWFSDEDRREIFGDFRLKVLTSAESYNPKKNTSVRTWSKFVVYSTIVDYMRKHKEFLPIYLVGDDNEEYEIEQLASSYTCEDEVIGWDSINLYEDYLKTCPDLDVQMMTLSLSGYSVKEISEICSVPAAKVSSILFRMRKNFKKAYTRAA